MTALAAETQSMFVAQAADERRRHTGCLYRDRKKKGKQNNVRERLGEAVDNAAREKWKKHQAARYQYKKREIDTAAETMHRVTQ